MTDYAQIKSDLVTLLCSFQEEEMLESFNYFENGLACVFEMDWRIKGYAPDHLIMIPCSGLWIFIEPAISSYVPVSCDLILEIARTTSATSIPGPVHFNTKSLKESILKRSSFMHKVDYDIANTVDEPFIY